MKNKIAIVASIVWCLFIFSCQPADQQAQGMKTAPFDEAAETAAMMQVMENETKCFLTENTRIGRAIGAMKT